ncbi:MAG TPA: DUF4013 domain-containing protein [Methanocella sp.]|uniref:DUF4013 domain-containing protein n=1 Tax=Methanocella sp. TaxID=2052833 RepID=UPI002C66C760|nr:DUF4013 domain-containing protein [Methanocella sp.]HTY90537.1 DUF4013 domain-containing protein [Methanocella sp.]
MPRNDFLETLIDALKYASSNISALLVGGIVFLLSAFIVGLPFFLGYITRCMRETITGNGILPEWDNIMDMFWVGLHMVIVFLAYALAYLVIISLIAIPVYIFRQLNMPNMVLLSTIVLVLTMAIVAVIFCVVFFASWVLFATTGSIRVALTPGRVQSLISRNPNGYVVALLASVAIIAIASVSALLVVIIPWVGFAAFSSLSFIYSKYYQANRGMV